MTLRSRLVLALIVSTAFAACSSPPQASSIIQPAGARAFPTIEPGAGDNATQALETTAVTKIYAPGIGNFEAIECIGGTAYGDNDFLNGQVATIGANEKLRIVPETSTSGDIAAGTSTIRGEEFIALTDDGHEGMICGGTTVYVDPATKEQ